ncbi:hypothetical protein [Bradyrhizobium sp. 2]|uniref:hypothetical protein n=1 Tax=Bradyrhizobium sp. 2 TaxID=190045 RepID=UPI001FF77F6A|nr:hypothetical protein [Bradyrhizobium sp. 2]
MLRTGGDHDLVDLAAHAACGPKIVANRLAQLQQATRIAIAEMMSLKRSQRARREFAPQFGATCIQQRATQVEGTLVILRRHIDEIAEAVKGGRACRGRYRPRLAAMRRCKRFRQIGRNVSPRPLPAEGITFG